MKFVLGGIIALLLAIMIAPQLNLRGNLVGALLIVAFGFLVCYGFVAIDGRNRFFIKSDLRDDGGDAAADLPRVSDHRLDGTAVLRHRAFDRRHRLYRGIQWRHDFAGSEDRFSRRLDAEISANRDPGRSACVRRRAWDRFCWQ